MTLYKAKNIRTFKTVRDAKIDILTNGPIQTSFAVFEDFLAYSKGVYKHIIGKFLGGHSIKVVGWGVEGGIKYWIGANSWGIKWGEEGYFRI